MRRPPESRWDRINLDHHGMTLSDTYVYCRCGWVWKFDTVEHIRIAAVKYEYHLDEIQDWMKQL